MGVLRAHGYTMRTVTSGPRKRWKDLVWTTTAYFGEGLPYSFLHQLVTEYLTGTGASRAVIGYTSWFHLPVTLKPLWAPWIDVGGARRSVMIAAQLVLGMAMMGSAALVDDEGGAARTVFFWSALALLSIVHAVHDIACDGFYIVALDERGRALYSGTRIAAFRAAMYVGSGALVILAGVLESWMLSFALAGVVMILVGLVNALLVPRIDEPRTEQGEKPWIGFVSAFRSFFAQPHATLVLVFVLTYRLGDVFTFAMSSPLFASLGMDTAARGILRTIGLTASIVGSVLAGGMLARGGLERWFVPFTYAMALPFYLLLAVLKPGFWWIALVYVAEQFAGALAGTALPVFLMQRTRRAFSASHYAFFTAIVALMSTVAGGLSGHLSEAIGHVSYFAFCFVASVPALILVHKIPKAPLETEEAPG